MENRYLWELVSKKTSGEASEKELGELDRLLQNKPDIRYLLEMMDNYWSLPTNQEEEAYAREALERHKQRLAQHLRDKRLQISMPPERDRPIAGNSRQRISRRTLLIAAGFALLIASGTWALYQGLSIASHDMNVVTTKAGSKTKLALPDGTLVWLNAGSKLSYPNDFTHALVRTVELCGEAFFEVKHDAGHPFIIHTQYLDIRDIGTSFDVKAYPQDGVTEATLIRGSIEVTLRKDPAEKLTLRPHEKIIYSVGDANNRLNKQPALKTDIADNKNNSAQSALTGPLRAEKIVPLIDAAGDSLVSETAWVNNQLVFRNEKFEDLAVRLERWYDVKINIQSAEVANYTFTGIFQGETIEQALKELQMTRLFHFTLNKNKIKISR